MRTFGEGISHLFLYPYNTKVWGYPLESLDVNWMIDRVAVPDVERVKRNILEGKDDVTWGPNNKFRYPLKGGTGAIWRGVANLLQPAHLRFRHVVESVDLLARKVRCQNGETFQWDTLITSIPLDRLCGISEGLGAAALSASRALVHSSIHIVGVGVRGPRPAALDRKCWMYFPEDHSPYYRITIFSNYSPFNVPRGQGYWSLMAEVCESPYRPVDPSALEESVLRAMREDCLIPGTAEVVSFWQRREEYGYPTPFLGRDATLALILPELERWQVYSRGRFGAWKYEVSNQDHSAMQGVQVVNRLLLGEPEVTLTTKS
jgi:protoporphyrinogen oxidase